MVLPVATWASNTHRSMALRLTDIVSISPCKRFTVASSFSSIASEAS